MNFVDISTLNIVTELDALKRETQRYSLYLYQHNGVFYADNTRIGNDNQFEAKTKFLNLLRKAKQENISLVTSPEYSCPKSVIDFIIDNEDLHPSQNKIWALGGESLNKEDLNNLNELKDESIFIYFEDIHNNSDKNYVDPLYYIFKGQHNGENKLIILIQFKSNHMGGLWSSQLEPNNLIQGNNVYIIKNNINSVRLMSFICSQAMNFNASFEQDLIDNHSWTDSPFLFFSLQFNPDPSHQNFIAFRQFILQRERRELITLNWGLETTYKNGNYLYSKNNAPRSGIYFKTPDLELDYEPKNIINNHNKGLFFLQIKRDKRVYFLSRNIDLFKIENKSVNISIGVPEQQRREGPTVTNIYNFTEDLHLTEIEKIEDNYIAILKDRGVKNKYLLNEEISIVDKEILLNISTGKIKSRVENRWADIIHLNSFSLNELNECNNRLTYTEDTYQLSKDVRKNNCEYISKLDEILADNSNYPSSIEELKYKPISLSYSNSNDFRYNLIDDEGIVKKATICFIGSESKMDAKRIYNNIRKIFDKDSATIRRVVVFYTKGSQIEKIFDPNANLITETPIDPTSIS